MDTPTTDSDTTSIYLQLPPDILQRMLVLGHIRLDTLAKTFTGTLETIYNRDEYWSQLAEYMISSPILHGVNWRLYLSTILRLRAIVDVDMQTQEVISTGDTQLWDIFASINYQDNESKRIHYRASFFRTITSNSVTMLSHLMNKYSECGMYEEMSLPSGYNRLDISNCTLEILEFILSNNLVLLILQDVIVLCDSIQPNLKSLHQYKLMSKIKYMGETGLVKREYLIEEEIMMKVSRQKSVTPLELDILNDKQHKVNVLRLESCEHIIPILVRSICFEYSHLDGNHRVKSCLELLKPNCDIDNIDILRLFVPVAITSPSVDNCLSSKDKDLTLDVVDEIREYIGNNRSMDTWVFYSFYILCRTFGLDSLLENKKKQIMFSTWNKDMSYMNRLALHSENGNILTPKNIKYMFKRLSYTLIEFVLNLCDASNEEKRLFYSKHIHLAILSKRRSLLKQLIEIYKKDFVLDSLRKSEYLSTVNMLELNGIAYNLLIETDLLSKMRISILGDINLYNEGFNYSHYLHIKSLLTKRVDIEAYYYRLILSKQHSRGQTQLMSHVETWMRMLEDIILSTRYVSNFITVSLILYRGYGDPDTEMRPIVRTIMGNPETRSLAVKSVIDNDYLYASLAKYLTKEERGEIDPLRDARPKDIW